MITQIIKEKARINMERAAIVQRYQNNQISAQDARKMIEQVDSQSIMTPKMRRVLSDLPEAQSNAGSDIPPVPEGLDPDEWPAIWHSLTEVEKAEFR